MVDDARFEDGGERPLNLGALDIDDLGILAALVQDAVLPVSEMRWDTKSRRLALLINRLRREDIGPSGPSHGAVERVQSLLVIEGVLGVSSQGIDRSETDLVLQILTLTFVPGDEAPSGYVELTLAGDGGIRAEVEALELSLRDVTRPYIAPSRSLPDHGA